MAKIMDSTTFKNTLREESTYPLTDSIYNWLMMEGELVSLGKRAVLIDYEQVDTSIYIILEGIIRSTVINNEGKELTIGFGLSGTIFYSTVSYNLGKPSLRRITACSPTKLLKYSKAQFCEKIANDHDFCKWVLGNSQLTIAYHELKSDGLNTDALNKYQWLKEDRPEIIENVPDKIIASYLNITEVHLSRIKSKLLKK